MTEPLGYKRDRDLEWLAHERVRYSALSQAPDLFEAHARLAKHYIAKLHYAETRKRGLAAEQALEQLKAHVHALPAHHAQKATWLAYITGQSNLNLSCTHSLRFRIHKYQLQNRQLADLVGIDKFPIEDKLLEMGGYLITIESPEIVPTCYHLKLQTATLGSTPPEQETLNPYDWITAEDDIFIPAGWTYVRDLKQSQCPSLYGSMGRRFYPKNTSDQPHIYPVPERFDRYRTNRGSIDLCPERAQWYDW